jgi:hypothetical protein
MNIKQFFGELIINTGDVYQLTFEEIREIILLVNKMRLRK